ncbi:glycoside hydrolase family 47 protein [Lineolata rhizophorae]|uniref:alpha-1,2-Mannosidase n=1 Tax=Lineolata rhizophorae TaxID=578093 RepID=A0A6A6P716_9PEZI|nr:glycoside hydrolase family 47 protein [Lineolata rhizophorae]
MAIRRRWSRVALNVVAVAVFFYILYRLRSPGGINGLFGNGPFSTGRFSWAHMPVRNRVESYIPLPQGSPQALPNVQYNFPPESADARALRQQRQAEVKRAFERTWKAYRERAWMADELAPISGGSKNTFGGWAATLIDTLDTLYIMGMEEEFREAVAAVDTVDFSTSTLETINVFETTIRHLGGLLAAFDLSGEPLLLRKAVEVADMLYVAFDTPNRMPITRWNPHVAKHGNPQTANDVALVAEVGSLSMEFTRLAQITGDNKWYDAVARVTLILESQQSKTKLPGMWPVVVDARRPDFATDNSFTLGAMADSVYEYLPKMHALLGGLEPVYQNMYNAAMPICIRNNLFRPMVPDNADIFMSGNVRVQAPTVIAIEPQAQHLVCFAGGMFALGGRLFGLPEHVDIGRRLTDGCIWAYKNSANGIMPEVSHMVMCPREDEGECSWDEAKWKSEVRRRAALGEGDDVDEFIRRGRLPPGFSGIRDKRYILRPEAIESVFILYRITGEPRFQESAWDMFTAIMKSTQSELANAAVTDVTVTTTEGRLPKSDSMESFWTAETLKYFYLIYSDPALISLDEYVLNTEAHPFRRPR